MLTGNLSIDAIIKSSLRNKEEIKKEHKKLIDYYKNNPSILFSDLKDAIEELKDDNYYSNLLKEGAEKGINDFGANQFTFAENCLLDSLEKIKQQIDSTPSEIKNKNQLLTLFFYDLLIEPDVDNGSKIILHNTQIDWRDFFNSFYSIMN